MKTFICHASIAIALVAMAPDTATSQVPIADARSCAENELIVWRLMYTALECNCTNYVDPHEPANSRWEFRSEPMISRAPSGSPDRTFRPGDVIIAIDGYLITTREGGRRFAQVEAGTPVRVRVRRRNGERELIMLPEAECIPGTSGPVAARPPASPSPNVVVVPSRTITDRPRVTVRPDVTVGPARPALPPAPLAAQSPGRLGLSVSCSMCRLYVDDGRRAWDFSQPPQIESIERDGPAFRAGLRSGDVITHIDDLDITTEEGGRRFGGVEPDEEIVLRFRRDGRDGVAQLVAARRDVAPQPTRADRVRAVQEYERALVAYGRAVGAGAGRQPGTVRFSGAVGDVTIQVTGEPVTVTQTDTEVIIVSGDITVRIRKTEGR